MYSFTQLPSLRQEPTMSYNCSQYGVRDGLGAAAVAQSPFKAAETENTRRCCARGRKEREHGLDDAVELGTSGGPERAI